MPNVLIEPNVSLDTRLSEIPTERKIPNFSSKLFFFDHMIFGAQKTHIIDMKTSDKIRNFHQGPQIKFLAERGLASTFSGPGIDLLGPTCLRAKEEFEDGRFIPRRSDDLEKLKRISNVEVFVSDRLARTYSNEHPVLTIEFIDGIPIPPNSWSPDGILNFKSKRYSEYRNFWRSITTLAADIEFKGSLNIEADLKNGIIEGLNEYAIYSQETFGARLRDSLTVNMTLPQNATIVAAMFGPQAQNLHSLNLPIEYYLTIGSLGAIKLALGMKRSAPPLSQTASGLSYLSRIRRGK